METSLLMTEHGFKFNFLLARKLIEWKLAMPTREYPESHGFLLARKLIEWKPGKSPPQPYNVSPLPTR